MATIGSIKIRIGGDISSLQRSLKKAERSLQRSGRKLAEIGSRLSAAVTLPVLAIGAAALKTAGDYDSLEKGMESMMGSAEAARTEIALLRKEALKPGLNFKQALKGSVRLQAVKVDTELARRALAGFGNALALVGGTGEQLDGVTLALSQIAAKGKISAEEINQIAERVPQIRQILKDGFGTADTEEIQKLGIGFEEFITTAIVELEKLPKAQSGIKNSIENTKLALEEAGAIIGKKLFPIFEKIAKVVVKLATAFGNLPDGLQTNIIQFGLLAAAIGPVLSVMGSLKLAAAGLLGGLGSALGIIQAGFLALISPIGIVAAVLAGAAYVIVNNWGEGKKTLVGVANAFVAIYQKILPVRAALEYGVLQLKTLINVGKSFFNGFAKGFQKIGQIFQAVVLGQFEKIPKLLTDSITGAFSQVKQTIGKFGEDVGDGFTNAIEGRDGVSFITESDIDKTTDKLSEILASVKAKFLGAGVATDIVDSVFSDLSGKTFDRDVKGGGSSKKEKAETPDTHQFDRIFGQDAADINTQTSLLPEGLQEHIEKVKELGEKYASISDRASEVAANIGESFGSILENGIEDGLASLGQTLGDVIAGTASGTQLLGGVLSSIAGIMVKLGKLAIGAGIAIKGIKESLKSLNPVVAIAGGVALVALGSFVKNKAAKLSAPKLAKGGLAYGETLATVGDNFNAAVDPEVIAPLSKLQDILSNTMQNLMPKNNFDFDTKALRANLQPAGGNITLDGEFRILGTDLILAVDKAKQQNYRTTF